MEDCYPAGSTDEKNGMKSYSIFYIIFSFIITMHEGHLSVHWWQTLTPPCRAEIALRPPMGDFLLSEYPGGVSGYWRLLVQVLTHEHQWLQAPSW